MITIFPTLNVTYKTPRPGHLLECFERTPLIWPCLSHHPKVSHQARLMIWQQQLVLKKEKEKKLPINSWEIFRKLKNIPAKLTSQDKLSQLNKKAFITQAFCTNTCF